MPSNTCKVTDMQFIMLVINNMVGTTVNFQNVADGAGMSSASAATTKYSRMKKAHSLPSDDATSTPSPAGKAKTTPNGEAKNKGSCATTTSSKKRKVDVVSDTPEATVKAEADGEDN